jgi:Xaa-Pro aminopeptidase
MSRSKIFLKRIATLQAALQNEGLDGFFIEDPVDLFYFTGLKMSLGHLFVLQDRCTLFVDGRYTEAARGQKEIAVETLSDANETAFLKGVSRLGFRGDRMVFAHYTHLRKKQVKLISKPSLIQALRRIKDPEELSLLQKSAHFNYKAYAYLRKQLKVGITEEELVKRLKIYCLEQGSEGVSFDPIIAFGKNSALPHYHPGGTKLRANDIVLIDMGVVLEGYCSDMTRVDFFGTPDPKLKDLYEVNLEAQRAALSKCRPGVKLKELDLAARQVMRKAGVEELFVHSLGHGIGLELHESPRIKFDGADRSLKLEPGMVITVEPGLYLPGKGGVRYEDTVVITPTGYVNLYPEP